MTSGTTRPTASASSKSLDVTGTAAAKSGIYSINIIIIILITIFREDQATNQASLWYIVLIYITTASSLLSGKAASASTKAPSRPTTAPASKSATTKPAGTTSGVASSKSATSISKSSASSAGSKTSGAPKTSTGLKKPSTGAAATGKQPPPASKTTGGGTGGKNDEIHNVHVMFDISKGTPKRPVSSGKASGIPTSRGTPTGKTASASSKLQKPGAGTPPTTRKPVAKPVAKVTEAPPAEPAPKKDPLPKKDEGHDEEEEEKEEIPVMATEYESDEEEDEGGHFESKTDIDIDDLISKIKK